MYKFTKILRLQSFYIYIETSHIIHGQNEFNYKKKITILRYKSLLIYPLKSAADIIYFFSWCWNY